MTITKAVLVYQGGLANVFAVKAFTRGDTGRAASRLLQADFHTCAMFARGLRAAGADVRTACCNQAGDIIASEWNCDYDLAPFSDSFTLVGGVL